ncbi:GGDEF domain-containing protein, partial [bacterium]|nr:GGDEF domain-containing protein [bacterium]
VLMVDIDYFKSINDQYGHAAGDSVIISIANLMKRVIRASDQVARIGGDEFVVLMPETESLAALNVAERLCSEAASEIVVFGTGVEIRYSVSVGVAVLDPLDQDFTKLAQRADSALYRAKRGGRNSVVFAQVDQDNQKQS